MPKKSEGPSLPRHWTPASSDDRWLDVVSSALRHLGQEARLSQIYDLIQFHPKARGKKHWKARVRATLEKNDQFVRVAEGLWGKASRYAPKDLEEFRRRRASRWPKRQAT